MVFRIVHKSEFPFFLSLRTSLSIIRWLSRKVLLAILRTVPLIGFSSWICCSCSFRVPLRIELHNSFTNLECLTQLSWSKCDSSIKLIFEDSCSLLSELNLIFLHFYDFIVADEQSSSVSKFLYSNVFLFPDE